MGMKILIVVFCLSGMMKVNIAVLTKLLNLEARFVAYLLFLIIWTNPGGKDGFMTVFPNGTVPSRL